MLATLNAESLLDTRLVHSARRLSDTMGTSGRRLVSQLSQRSLASKPSNTKRVHFNETPTMHSYPAVLSFLEKNEIWYTLKDCRTLVLDDVAELRLANKFGEAIPEKRGLENVAAPERKQHKRYTKRYTRTVVQKWQESANRRDFNSFVRKSNQKSELFDSIARYSLQVTAPDKDFAYRMACEDELHSRMIYLQDGTVKSSEAFAAKSAESVMARAVSASAAPVPSDPNGRRSLTAKSA